MNDLNPPNNPVRITLDSLIHTYQTQCILIDSDLRELKQLMLFDGYKDLPYTDRMLHEARVEKVQLVLDYVENFIYNLYRLDKTP